MDLRWGWNQNVTPHILHAIDAEKKDGNPFAICGGELVCVGEQRCEFGESRAGKCVKCFKISRRRLQLEKKANR